MTKKKKQEQEDTLANQYRPKTFKDFNNENIITKGTVEVLKNLIANNEHAKAKGLFLSGSSGSGKSTLALLYAKATLCLNRKEGEFEPCGECEVCTGLNTSNIYHYTISNPSEAREPIRNLIERAYQYPIKITERDDQFRQFIIIDEIELATPELIAMLLDPLEHSPSTTTWILVSMDLDKLERRDPITKDAIESRTAHLPLGKLSEDAQASSLIKHYPDLDEDAARAIARLSEGNMRRAWNTLSTFLITHKVEDITDDLILESKLGEATDQSRREMWVALSKGEGNKVKEYFSKWLSSNSDVKTIARFLEEDILNALNSPNEKAQYLLLSLSRWFLSTSTYSLVSVFLSHLGTDIYSSKKENITELHKKEEKKKTLIKITRSPNAEIIRVKSHRTGIPRLFFCESIKDLKEAYAEELNVIHNN